MTRFAKRAVAPVASSSDASPINASELLARRDGIEAELRTLTSQRAALALSALQGSTNATTAIEAIDRERQALAAQIETLNAGLQALKSQERQQVDIGRNLARLTNMLQVTVTERRDGIVFNIQRGNYRDMRAAHIGHYLDLAEPMTVARELVTPLVNRQLAFRASNASGSAIEANRTEQQRLDRERNSEIERLACELVASVTLPPLPAEIAALVQS